MLFRSQHLHAGILRVDAFDRVLHAGDGRRHQGAEPYDARAALPDRGDDLLRWHVLAQVNHLEVVVLQNDLDDVLADVVYVAVHRAEDDGPQRRFRVLLRGGGQSGLQALKGGLGGVGGLDQLR